MTSGSSLRAELERSFGDGPPAPPVGAHLEAGRRALRRRRTATGAVASVLVLVVGYAALVGPGPSERTSGPVASDPTPSETSEPAPRVQAAWDEGETVRYRDGVLEVRPGVVVHERIDNPYGYAAPKASAALDLTFEGQRSWNLLELNRKGQTYSGTVPNNGWASFADWVADQTDQTTGGDDGWPETMVLDGRGDVVAAPGSEVLQRTDDPRLGETFAAPGDVTGAAVVRAGEDGQDYFVVWRVVDGELDVITTPPADVVGASFQELLSYARGQYASGEGLR